MGLYMGTEGGGGGGCVCVVSSGGGGGTDDGTGVGTDAGVSFISVPSSLLGSLILDSQKAEKITELVFGRICYFAKMFL